MHGKAEFGASGKSDLVKKLMWKSFASEFARSGSAIGHPSTKSFRSVLHNQGISQKRPHKVKFSGWNIRDYLAHPIFVPQRRMKADTAESFVPPKRFHESGKISGGTKNATDAIDRYRQAAGTTSDFLMNPIRSSDKKRIERAIERASRSYNIPANIIRGLITAESGFNTRAVSKAGAMGLMQLMPATAKELGVTDPFDIEQNIEGGVKYFRKMLNLFDGNLIHAIAAYNAGPGAVIRHKGIPPYGETQKYVQRVLKFSGLA